MNFKQIETFRAVMLTGSMTVAAQQLHTSQPNVSRGIGKLEAEIGFELFDRLAGRLVATKGGEALFKEVERAFVGLDSLTESARAIRELGVGTLRVAAAASISMSVLPLAIRMFSEKYPLIRIVVDTSESSIVANWIATQHCDIGFVSYISDKPGVVASVIHTENAVCVMPSRHPLARKRRLVPQDLNGERFISLPSGSSSRCAVDAAFPEEGRIMVLETTYAATICRMVSEGLGLSLLNPIVSRTMKLPGIVAIPFKPDVPFKSYMLRAQLAPRDTHVNFFVSCMRTAFKSF
ncbi:LysR substrate-binding domain-containing protein [Polaromonas sp. JS666]|uniref:LysR substrate-binding domain-containing protein n=1 Tax=Polaromonas sp. (strain JS666 / ATCC BAA-500) TaxID=296591 RepID=UPI000053787A|nr:LysR substrate-binding domain-containing protein [Polaromonas sp. JS666]ABE46275.1 transcriptional regulator, LysR family [Polaromonas sp. JS666]